MYDLWTRHKNAYVLLARRESPGTRLYVQCVYTYMYIHVHINIHCVHVQYVILTVAWNKCNTGILELAVLVMETHIHWLFMRWNTCKMSYTQWHIMYLTLSPFSLFSVKVSTTLVALYSDAHRGFIYSLSWSHDSYMISSASADGLVKYVLLYIHPVYSKYTHVVDSTI